MKTNLRLASLLVLAACAKPSPSPTPQTASPAVQTADAPRAPLVVSWSQKSLDDHQALVEARVTFNAPFSLPTRVTVGVPPGATLVSGPQSFELEAQATAGTKVTLYTVSFAAIPAGDLVLTADAQGVGNGVHAQSVYRFGRAAPVVAGPKASGPDLKINGVDLGPSIPLEQKPPAK